MYNQSSYHPYPQLGGAPAPGQGQQQPQGAGPAYAVHAMPQQGYPMGQYQSAYPGAYNSGYPAVQPQTQTPFINYTNDRFLKGVLIGAAAAYVLTNESVQRSAIKGAIKVWSMLQGGVEEIKERFHDAEAEIRAAESPTGD